MSDPDRSHAARRRWSLRWAMLLERPSPLAKHLPTVFLLLLGLLLVGVAPAVQFTSALDALIGVAGVVAATILAVAMTVRGVWDGWVVVLVPTIDILSLGLFRSGTGGAASLFGAFILVPIIWLATVPMRRAVVVLVVIGLTALGQLLPYFRQPPANGEEWLRGVVTPIVFAMVAFVVAELSHLQRQRTGLAERLAAFREAALQENSEVLVRLREEESRYRRLLGEFQSVWDATTEQAVISTDLDGVVVRWNPGAARLFGRTEEETFGRFRVDALFPEDALELLDDDASDPVPDGELPSGLRRVLARAAAGEPVDHDLGLFGARGEVVPMRLTVTARSDEHGAPLGYLLVMTDETRAAEVARMKDEFVGMISHELRTPLTSILGYIELLGHDRSAPLTEDQQQFLSVIDRNAHRLLKLVSDLLFVAQVESGRFSIEPRDGDVVPVILAAIESARPAAERAGVEIVDELPADSPAFRFDPERIGQAIDNVLSNAIKFTPRGGRVVVGLDVGPDQVRISVRDTGIGIPDDEVGRLFVRFFRASTAIRNATPGVGLGLTITKAIVVAHGGSMDVSSRVGEGTVMRILLPRQASPAAAPS